MSALQMLAMQFRHSVEKDADILMLACVNKSLDVFCLVLFEQTQQYVLVLLLHRLSIISPLMDATAKTQNIQYNVKTVTAPPSWVT
jgi:hypothetical protein